MYPPTRRIEVAVGATVTLMQPAVSAPPPFVALGYLSGGANAPRRTQIPQLAAKFAGGGSEDEEDLLEPIKEANMHISFQARRRPTLQRVARRPRHWDGVAANGARGGRRRSALVRRTGCGAALGRWPARSRCPSWPWTT